MARKLYWGTLVLMLHQICVYIARWRNLLIGFATDVGITDAAAKLDALITACEAITGDYENNINP